MRERPLRPPTPATLRTSPRSWSSSVATLPGHDRADVPRWTATSERHGRSSISPANVHLRRRSGSRRRTSPIETDQREEDRRRSRDRPRPDQPARRHQTFSARRSRAALPAGRSAPGRARRTSPRPSAGTATGSPMPVRSSAGPTDCRRPSRKPPSAAPPMLPMPPSTAAVNAAIPGRNPMKKLHLLEREGEQHARDAREDPADHERGDHDAVDVDAHQARDLLVLGDRAHRLPGLRPSRRTICSTTIATIETTKTTTCDPRDLGPEDRPRPREDLGLRVAARSAARRIPAPCSAGTATRRSR